MGFLVPLPAADGAEPTAPPPPVVMGRVCGPCGAFVTVLGRAGVLCSHPACPFPRLGPEPRAAVGKSAGWKYQPREGLE